MDVEPSHAITELDKLKNLLALEHYEFIVNTLRFTPEIQVTLLQYKTELQLHREFRFGYITAIFSGKN
ncbi:hypothetical protein CW304_28020 [Bacillus sp. UFRGS-B20]|nr:hypothetical protein CW304_28020 [Bacillus sp. UFRGS-B20]